MAKIGYVFRITPAAELEDAREWMLRYGCVQILEESCDGEPFRPLWKKLLANLERGDELVLTKLSHAIRSSRELPVLLEYCRVKRVRLISILDAIDSGGKLFPATTIRDILEVVGALPEEVAALCGHSRESQSTAIKWEPPIPHTKKQQVKQERERTIVNMYNGGHSIKDIWAVSGYKSRSTIFRILNKYGVELNRRSPHPPLREVVRRERKRRRRERKGVEQGEGCDTGIGD